MSEALDAIGKSLIAALDRIEKKVDRIVKQTAARKPGDDERVYKDPKEKYWQGESFIGGNLSEAPADYLRAYAKYKSACAYANRKEGDPAKAQYAEKDDRSAKLASEWAAYREADGEAPAAQPKPAAKGTQESFDDDGSDQIPF